MDLKSRLMQDDACFSLYFEEIDNEWFRLALEMMDYARGAFDDNTFEIFLCDFLNKLIHPNMPT